MSAFVLALMLLILLFTQRQITTGVVDAFDAMTAVPGEQEGSAAEIDGEGNQPREPSEPRGVGIEYYEPRPLTVEVARTKVFIATQRALNHVRSHAVDDQAP
ncbi:MAG: hypothetical protein ACJAYU_005351 [Bradymonadia bacterium]